MSRRFNTDGFFYNFVNMNMKIKIFNPDYITDKYEGKLNNKSEKHQWLYLV